MKLEFRKMQLKDVYQFEQWGFHTDPRFFQYNFPYIESWEFKAWYQAKQKWLTRKVYGLFIEDYPLGFVTLKHINWFMRRAELGIAIDPNHLSEGFGTELLKRFLNHVFTKFPIKTMTLRVAAFNHRARKSYEKIGFEVKTVRKEPFEEQTYKEEILAKYPDLFELVEGVLVTEFIIMTIDQNDFYRKNDIVSR